MEKYVGIQANFNFALNIELEEMRANYNQIKEFLELSESKYFSGKRKIGSIVYLGTGGSIQELDELKQMFKNPETYFIPTYYKQSEK